MTNMAKPAKLLAVFLSLFALLALFACAPQATPTPEPKATTPPQAVTPQPQAKGEVTVTPAPQPKTTQPPAAATKPFYEGKTITLELPHTPGGTADTYPRVLASYMSKYIPGKPNIVAQNHGGTGMIWANHMFKIAKPDGLTFGMAPNGLYNSELAGDPAVQYKFAEFNWIGNMNSKAQIMEVRADVGIKNVKDLQAYTGPVLRNGMPGKEAGGYAQSRVIEQILGIKFRYVFGLPSSPEMALAMQQKEIDVMLESMDGLLSARPQWIKDGYINILVQTGATRHPTTPDIPCIGEFATNDADKAMAQLANAGQLIGRVFYAPPGMAPDKVQILRQAFAQTLKDPDFLAAAAKAKLPIDLTTGEEVQKIAAKIIADGNDPAIKAKYLALFQ